MIYRKNGDLIIRSMTEDDARIIYETYLSYNWHPVLDTYRNYYTENGTGRRITFCAEIDGKLAGHVSLILKPDPDELGPFREEGLPLVSDFTVFFAYHRQGIGTALLDVSVQVVMAKNRLASNVLNELSQLDGVLYLEEI